MARAAETMAQRQAEIERAREQQEADWRWLCAAPQGRRILREVLGQTRFLEAAVADSVALMAAREGARGIGAYLYARFTHAVDGGALPGLLADVMGPDVRNRDHDRTRRRPDRAAPGAAGE